MDAIEKAIRNAFDKGNAGDRAFREKVYRSAFGVLEKALAANPNMTPAIAQRRRDSLSATISSIESEFLPAVAAPPVRQPEPADEQFAPESEIRPEPALEPSLDGEERYRPDAGGEADYGIDPPDRLDRPATRRRGRWAAVFIVVTLASLVAIGLWWAFGTGMFQSPEQRDGSVPNPPPVLEEEDFTPEDDARPPVGPGASSDPDDWIAIFDPADPTTVSAPGDSAVEAMTDDGEAFVRIRSGASGSPVLFDVGPGVLETIAGRRAIFSILAQTGEGQETQMSVECSLGELGDCGRKRFAVGATREEFLFEIDTRDAAPGSGGTIAVNPDIEGSGRPVDIHAIRVTLPR